MTEHSAQLPPSLSWVQSVDRPAAQSLIEQRVEGLTTIGGMIQRPHIDAGRILWEALKGLRGAVFESELVEELLQGPYERSVRHWRSIFDFAFLNAYGNEFGAADNPAIQDAIRRYLRAEIMDATMLPPIVGKMLAKRDLARSFATLFDQNPYTRRVPPSRSDSSVSWRRDAATFVELDGRDLDESARTIDVFVQRVLCGAFPEIDLPGYVLSRDILANASLDSALRKIREQKILPSDLLQSLSPRDFEKVMSEVFAEFGYEVQLTKQTRDGGCDLLCIAHLGATTLRIIVECKRYKNPVGVQLLRQLVGANAEWNANKAIFVTTSGYTSDARAYAAQNLLPGQLDLYDRDDVWAWIRGSM